MTPPRTIITSFTPPSILSLNLSRASCFVTFPLLIIPVAEFYFFYSTVKMALETLKLEHLPSEHEILLGFYRNVQNASFLHQQLLARNSQFEYAFIDASVVRTEGPSPLLRS